MEQEEKDLTKQTADTSEQTMEEPDTADVHAEEDTSGEAVQDDTAEADAQEGKMSRAEEKAAKKKAKADKKQDKYKEKIEELEDRVKRQMAEFDNFRKRTEKEKTQMFETGAKSVVEKILPVVDNFERGLQSLKEGEDNGAFADGMNMVYKQLMTELENIGVKPIEAVGQEFNPEFHNAVMHVEDEAFGENEVIEEFQKGYLYRDSVIRHSMVKVAN